MNREIDITKELLEWINMDYIKDIQKRGIITKILVFYDDKEETEDEN